MLVLRVEFLTGVCMATRHNDPTRSAPEWPPHPDRLYSALVAAAAEPDGSGGTDLPSGAVQALRWLAEQCWGENGECKAPLLHASHAHRRTMPAVPMPSNPHEDEVWQKPKKDGSRSPQKSFDFRTLLPVHRKKALLPVPAVVPEEPAVYFVWPDADAGEQLAVLRSICDRVTYLGRSRSLVHVTIEDDAPSPTHVPDPFGGLELRVPAKRRLDYLIDKFRRDGGKPEPNPPTRYRLTHVAPLRPEGMRTVFQRLWVFQPGEGDPALPAVATIKLTQALRRALLKSVHDVVCGCERWREQVPSCHEARECYAKIPGTLSGHAPDCSRLDAPHVAFAALPFVHPVQRHADGGIKGVGVLVPRDLERDVSVMTVLAQGLRGIEREGLRIPEVGQWHLREVLADDPSLTTLDPRTWTRPARTWTTVTPMVFGRFPKARNGGEAKVVLDSLQLVGIDPSRVVDLAVGRHSPLHGVPPSWSFKTNRGRDEAKGPRRPIRHVTVRFDAPVAGPLALGPLRYFGLGLMRPLEA
ncbi:MAG: type I-U CRISPR-associated protein Csb2 [Planctomycetota bacterium]